MSRSDDRERGSQWIEDQLVQLGQLRNAGTRSPEFKSWRQHTLTLVQRIWVDDPSRAARFRRIPFTSTVHKPDDRQVRDAYERGCAEAVAVLREMQASLNAPGSMPKSGGAPRAATTPPAPAPPPVAKQPSQAPTIAPRATRTPPPPASPPRVVRAPAPPPPAPAPRAVRSPLPPPPSVAPRTERPQPPVAGPAPEPSRIRAVHKQNLRDMLGLGGGSESGFAPPAPATPERSHAPEPVAEPEPEFETEIELELVSELEIEPDFELEIGPELELEAEPIDADPIDADPPDASTEMQRATAELLDHSPVLNSSGRPVPASRRRAVASPTSLAMTAMAEELEYLGVPRARRSDVHAALLELARRLDARDLDWDALRDAVGLVMEFPPVARRALPLLVPFLDRAA